MCEKWRVLLECARVCFSSELLLPRAHSPPCCSAYTDDDEPVYGLHAESSADASLPTSPTGALSPRLRQAYDNDDYMNRESVEPGRNSGAPLSSGVGGRHSLYGMSPEEDHLDMTYASLSNHRQYGSQGTLPVGACREYCWRLPCGLSSGSRLCLEQIVVLNNHSAKRCIGNCGAVNDNYLANRVPFMPTVGVNVREGLQGMTSSPEQKENAGRTSAASIANIAFTHWLEEDENPNDNPEASFLSHISATYEAPPPGDAAQPIEEDDYENHAVLSQEDPVSPPDGPHHAPRRKTAWADTTAAPMTSHASRATEEC